MRRQVLFMSLMIALLGIGAGSAAHAEEFLVQSTEPIPPSLTAMLEGINGVVLGTMPAIGVLKVESDDPNFLANADGLLDVIGVARNQRTQWVRDDDMSRLDDATADPRGGNGRGKGNNNDDTVAIVEPYRAYQWALDAIEVDEAWATGARGAGVTVAVLDTGFDLDHPDLVDNINLESSRSFVPGEDLRWAGVPTRSHGTHVAGIIAAAKNGIGVVGVAPEAELMLVKVVGDDFNAPFDWIIEGMVYAADAGADVLNMSLSGSFCVSGSDGCDENTEGDLTSREATALKNMINKAAIYANQKGAVVVTSAGNSSIDADHTADLVIMPSQSPNVISVSATGPFGWGLDHNVDVDRIASYTNYGASLIDVAAPGGDFDFDLFFNDPMTCGPTGDDYCARYDMVVSCVDLGYRWTSGTSAAAPHVAGVAALIIGANGGDMDPAHVRAKLRQTADDLGKAGRDPFYGFGRLNAANALR